MPTHRSIPNGYMPREPVTQTMHTDRIVSLTHNPPLQKDYTLPLGLNLNGYMPAAHLEEVVCDHVQASPKHQRPVSES